MSKRIIGNTTATPMPVPDWNQTNPNKADFIKNKPTIPVVDSALSRTSTNAIQNNIVSDEFIRLIGDTPVEDQIRMAIDAMKPKCTNITLLASNWVGDTNPWSQVVSISGVTEHSKIDLHATALQIVELQNNDIAFMAENDDGVVTIYALGSKPTIDYIIQAEITEVAVV